MPSAIVPNKIAVILFLVSWGMYLIAEAARTGSDAKPECTTDDDVDETAQSRLCEGYSAAAAWDMFGAICSLFAAGLVSRDALRNAFFLLSLACYGFGLTCEFGGQSSSLTYLDTEKTEQGGLESAAVFSFFSALAAVAAVVFAAKGMVPLSLMCFFLFLGIAGISYTSQWGWQSQSGCISSITDDYKSTSCSGYGFATFCGTVAMVVGLAFAALAFKKKAEFTQTWIAWFSWMLVIFLGYATYFATTAKIYCQSNYYGTSSNLEKVCQGFSAGAFWDVLAFVVAILGVVFSIKGMDEYKHASFMFSWSLFFLGYGCYLGGFSAYYCKLVEEGSTDNDNDNKIQCNGKAAACLFSILSFVGTLVGTYFGYRGGSGTHQPLDDVPTGAAKTGTDTHADNSEL